MSGSHDVHVFQICLFVFFNFGGYVTACVAKKLELVTWPNYIKAHVYCFVFLLFD